MAKVTRRHFISQALKAGAGLAVYPYLSSCSKGNPRNLSRKKILILGIDGMDPVLLTHFAKQGLMPNFLGLMQEYGYKKMRSSIPPQSPVAWSNFAVGASARVHGIFDFIHRDPGTMVPYFSTSRVSAPSNTLSIGNWAIPLRPGTTKGLREGKPFWEYLTGAGIPTTIFKIPGEFPVNSKKARCVSGMGTPDLLGSYGTFSLYTSRPPANANDISGGTVIPVKIVENKIDAELIGPVNDLKRDRLNTRIPFQVWRDPKNEVVKIELQDHLLIMTRGEWSDWIPLHFDLLPHVSSARGICKFLVKEIHPHFQMYVSPINIDPTHQSLPVTSPKDYGRVLADHIGLFGTQGLPADTKALSSGVFTEEEYLELSEQILQESQKALRYELEKLHAQTCGVLFFYLSNLDQDSHMYWRATDRAHPLYTPALGKGYGDTIRDLYLRMDKILGHVFSLYDPKDPHFRLILMSDHGFAPFYRSVNLNTWLLKNGYVTLMDPHSQDEHSFFENMNWSRTKAYGLGLNALYINIEGREKYGTVRKQEASELMSRLKKQLLAIRDPHTGEKAISRVWIGKEIYNGMSHRRPDLIIGWNRGYRASWETVLGGFPLEVFTDNQDRWSGDHCIDPFWVPAVLLSNRKILAKNPALVDVTATLLAEYNIPIPEQMTGRPLYEV